MDGVHDMGGMDGFGPVVREPNEPVFHADWEGRAIALSIMLSVVKGFTDDQYRQEIERIPPVDYLRASYYERWVLSMESLLMQSGDLQPGEKPEGPPAATDPDCFMAADVPAGMAEGAPRRQIAPDPPPRFAEGDAVLVRNLRQAGHTRLPRYIRGKRGKVIKEHGLFPFPEAVAAGRQEPPRRIYSVLFDAREVWGPDAPAGDDLVVDLWDPYLEPMA